MTVIVHEQRHGAELALILQGIGRTHAGEEVALATAFYCNNAQPVTRARTFRMAMDAARDHLEGISPVEFTFEAACHFIASESDRAQPARNAPLSMVGGSSSIVSPKRLVPTLAQTFHLFPELPHVLARTELGRQMIATLKSAVALANELHSTDELHGQHGAPPEGKAAMRQPPASPEDRTTP